MPCCFSLDQSHHWGRLASVAAFSSSSIFWTCPVLVLYVGTSALWFRLDVPPFPYYIVECWWSYVLVFFSVFQVKNFWANSNAITFYFRRGQTLSNCVYIWFVYAETRLSLFFIWNWRRKQHPSQSLLRKEGKKKIQELTNLVSLSCETDLAANFPSSSSL